MHLGTAFQLIDDVLDYSGDEAATGKHLGDDLAEGKPTLPLIHAMRHGSAEHSACVRHAIEEGEQEKLQEIVAIVRGTGALESTREAARTEARHAADCLKLLPQNKWTESLLEFAIQSVERHS